MKLKTVFLAMGACSLLGFPVMAQAGTTASASVGKVATLSGVATRQSAMVEKKKKDEGSGLALGLGLAGAAAAGVGIYLAVDKKDNSTSGS